MAIDDTANNHVSLQTLRHDHHEKGKNFVVVTLYVRNSFDVNIEFENDGLTAKFATRDASFLKRNSTDASDVGYFSCTIKTKHAIIPDESHFKVKPCNIEITLKKVIPNRWGGLYPVEQLSPRVKSKINQASQNLLLGGKSTPLTKKSSEESKQEVETELAPAPSKSQDKRNIHKSVGASLSADNQGGMIGLENYANNCYMNVVVQVLSNIQEVRDYFRHDHYLKDINSNNTLGSGGKVAKAFSDVVKALWTPGRRVFKPLALKNIMGRQCSLFYGWQQHDAQEFFASLLDNIHEDINQPLASDQSETGKSENGKLGKVDSDSSVNEKPDTAWFSHHKRNNSFIVKLFHGQLMSKLTCSSCHKVSFSFDPCAQISLPIPANKQHHKVLFFSRDFNQLPLLINVQISTANALLWHLLNIITSVVKVPPHLISTFKGVQDVAEDDRLPIMIVKRFKYIICCEVASKEEVDTVSLPVFQYTLYSKDFTFCDHCFKSPNELETKLKRCTRCYSVSYCSRECQTKHWSSHSKVCNKDLKHSLGVPFFITLDKENLSYKSLEENLRELSKHSIEYTHRRTEESSVKGDQVDNNKWSNFHIKSSSKMNCNDDACTLVTTENLSFDNLRKSTCLILEWQNSSSDEQTDDDVQSKDEPSHVIAPNEASPLLACKEPADHCSLADCLKLFMEPEKLDEKESWKCPKCKTPQAAKKEMALSSPPCLLLLHLKRFTYGEYGQKINKGVTYPLSGFDLSPYIARETRGKCEQPLLYDLTGVITHRGTMRMGHYTCMARMLNQQDDEELGWRQFNDDNVTKIRPEKVVSTDAYVLIYRIRNLNEAMKVDRAPSFHSSLSSSQESIVIKRKKADNQSVAQSYKNADRRSLSENSMNRFKRSMSSESTDDVNSDKKKNHEHKKLSSDLFRCNSALPTLASSSAQETVATKSLPDLVHSAPDISRNSPDISGNSPTATRDNFPGAHNVSPSVTVDYQRELSTSSDEYVDCVSVPEYELKSEARDDDKRIDDMTENFEKLQTQLSRESIKSTDSFASLEIYSQSEGGSDIDENDLD